MTVTKPPRPRWRIPVLVTAAGVVVIGGATAAFLLTHGGAPAGHPAGGHGSSQRWSLMASPSRGFGSALRSIACASRASCLAVGTSGALGLPATLVESWDGTTWTVVPSPGAGVDSWLNAVACGSASSCMAVGGDSPTGDSDDPADRTLVERWTGTSWAVVPSPTPGNGDQSDLQSVACPSADWCMAVGTYSPISDPYEADIRTLAESWNGAAWSVVPIPSPEGRQTALQSVSCTSPSWCVAVGTSSPAVDIGAGAVNGVTETWNGTRWSIEPGAGIGGQNGLQSVACTSPAWCVAVGFRGPAGQTATPANGPLAERWNGATWSVVAIPVPVQAQDSGLQSVTCASATSCVAAGSFSTAANPNQDEPFVEVWHGSRWSPGPSPLAGSTISAVSCVSPVSCIAVGRQTAVRDGIASQWQTVVETWKENA